MVKFSEAYEICKKLFVECGYSGIGTIYQSDEAWLFSPKLEEPEYGATPIVYPRNGDTPFFYNWSPESKEKYIDNAVIIS